jgi:DNA-directed RNA polymerase subunit RPC12/RpoP
MKNHNYIQISKDGTVECTECGLRNSNPKVEDTINCKIQ